MLILNQSGIIQGVGDIKYRARLLTILYLWQPGSIYFLNPTVIDFFFGPVCFTDLLSNNFRPKRTNLTRKISVGLIRECWIQISPQPGSKLRTLFIQSLPGRDSPVITADIELGCVKLPEVTTPTPSRRTTGSLIIPTTLLHLLILQLSLASLRSQTEPQTHVR